MVIINDMSERLAIILKRNGAAVRQIDSHNNTYAVTFKKEEITAHDFKGTIYERYLTKFDHRKMKREKKQRRLERKKFKMLRKKKFGRKWKKEEIKISNILWILMLSFLRKDLRLRFNNKCYNGRYKVLKIRRYESKQIKELHLKDLEGGSGNVIYVFPEIKMFRRLISKLFVYLKKKGKHTWLIERNYEKLRND
jgi:hypothetical protein